MKVKIFCENILNDLLPSVRAIIANSLTETYGMTQQQVSEKLGLTQPAVSQYANGLRGKRVKKILANKNMVEYIETLTAQLANGSNDLNLKVCELCSKSRKEEIFSKEELNPFICLLEVAGVKCPDV